MSELAKLELRIIVKATAMEAFDAWTKPELMKQWYAPGTMIVPDASADLVIGGAYSVEMKGEMGGKAVNPTVTGIYKEIIPNELLRFTWGWQGDTSPETLVTVKFREVDDGTEVTLTHERFTSDEARDKHQHGWQGCMDNLAKFINK